MAALAIPLRPASVEAWKAWIKECTGPRRKEFEDFNRRMKLTEHRVWYMEHAPGPLAIVVHEGPGGDTMLKNLAKSDHPFDTWFRQRVAEFHGVDFSALTDRPPSQNMMDWRSSEAQRSAKS